MWVRIQNKNGLINVNNVFIENKYDYESKLTKVTKVYKDEYYIKTYEGDNYVILGSYSTKEKALKVLEKIQDYINQQCKHIKNYGNEYIESNLKANVFQMPQDEEV